MSWRGIGWYNNFSIFEFHSRDLTIAHSVLLASVANLFIESSISNTPFNLISEIKGSVT